MQNIIKRIWLDVLKLSEEQIQLDFFDVDGDSISAMHIIMRLDQELNIKISISEIFLYPNLSALTEHINEQLPKR